MSYEYTAAASDRELEEILRLQQANLKSSLDNDENIKEGFVTVAHSLSLLKEINSVFTHSIAKYENCVVGYALCMHPSFGNDIPILRPMFQELHRLNKDQYMVMGQICIAKDHRNKGLFRLLYAHMRSELTGAFKHIVTEVDATNTRSLNAHTAIGFKILSKYSANDQDWIILSLPV